MAMTDYGVIMFKNGKMITADEHLDRELHINSKKFSIYPKGYLVEYNNEMIYEYHDKKHPYKKIRKHIDGVYFELTQKPDNNQLYVYIRNQNDIYQVFSGYGIGVNWKKLIHEYSYDKSIVRKLFELDKKEKN
ncbi:MAG: hypothetical protein ACLRT4_20225 [Thomasclavelia sp.]